MAKSMIRDTNTNGTLAVIAGTSNKDWQCRYGYHPNELDTIMVFKGGQLLTPNTTLGAADYDYEIGQFAEVGRIKFEVAIETGEIIQVFYYPIGGMI